MSAKEFVNTIQKATMWMPYQEPNENQKNCNNIIVPTFDITDSSSEKVSSQEDSSRASSLSVSP